MSFMEQGPYAPPIDVGASRPETTPTQRTGRLWARLSLSESQLPEARAAVFDRLWRRLWGDLGASVKDGRSYALQRGEVTEEGDDPFPWVTCRLQATALLTNAADAQVGEHVAPWAVTLDPFPGTSVPFVPRVGLKYGVGERTYRFLGWCWQREY